MPTEDPRYPADFDQATWEEDFARATDAGKLAGGDARREFEENGVPQSQLRPCDAEGQDGTTQQASRSGALTASVFESCDRVVYLCTCGGERPGVWFAAGGVSALVLDQPELVQAREQLRCLALIADTRALPDHAV